MARDNRPTRLDVESARPEVRTLGTRLGLISRDDWGRSKSVKLIAEADLGLVFGREAIEKYHADLFKQIHISDQSGKSDEYSPHIIGTAGNELWSNGEWSLTYQVNGGGSGPIKLKGFWSNIYVRDGDAWKTRMGMSNVTP